MNFLFPGAERWLTEAELRDRLAGLCKRRHEFEFMSEAEQKTVVTWRPAEPGSRARDRSIVTLHPKVRGAPDDVLKAIATCLDRPGPRSECQRKVVVAWARESMRKECS